MADLNTATPPQVSEGGLQYMRSLLDDPKWCADFPSQAVALRQSFDTATKITSQNKPEVTDARTPEQRYHDHSLGVHERPASSYALEVPTGWEPPEGMTEAGILGDARSFVRLFNSIRF